MYFFNQIEEKQRKLREKYLPQELRFRQLINYVDNVNPKAMEQLIIFMCWFNKNIGQAKTNQVLQLMQRIRMSGCSTLNARKLQAILMFSSKCFTKTFICDRLGISRTALNNWLKQAEELNIKVLSFTQEEYDLISELMISFDKLCRARNLIKGTLE